ncbi:type III secretion protein [Caballeronia calidae]|uniref:Type III secretion protein n=2 Tax=Caballeronia calidae TaxID=1777139 RepID=A0A158EG72_9BURK|nr:type III secretion protein [Caballeronia calidae]
MASAFMDVLTVALTFHTSEDVASEVHDLETIVNALHVLSPNLVELDTLDALIKMRRGDWIGAVQVLSAVEAHASNFVYASALNALALYKMGDPSWMQKVNFIQNGEGNEQAKSFVAALEACAKFPEFKGDSAGEMLSLKRENKLQP